MKKKKLDIIYEDKELLVVNKPAKQLTIATNKQERNTLYHEVYEYVHQKHKKNRIFIVHRLDRDTSGIVVFAKNEKIKHLLQEHWNELAITREYMAIVDGVIKEKGIIKSYLKETKTLRTYSTTKKDGKLAITEYEPITYHHNQTLLKIHIKTGRKNQIRVHMQDLGYPILGDKKYGNGKDPFHRMALIANKLELIHPVTHQKLVFETRLPKIFQNN